MLFLKYVLETAGVSRSGEKLPGSLLQKWKTDKGQSEQRDQTHQSQQSEHQEAKRKRQPGTKRQEKNFEIKIKLNGTREPTFFPLVSLSFFFSYSTSVPPTPLSLPFLQLVLIPALFTLGSNLSRALGAHRTEQWHGWHHFPPTPSSWAAVSLVLTRRLFMEAARTELHKVAGKVPWCQANRPLARADSFLELVPSTSSLTKHLARALDHEAGSPEFFFKLWHSVWRQVLSIL